MNIRTFVILALITVAPVVSSASPVQPGAYVSGFLGATFPQDDHVTSTDFSGSVFFEDLVKFDPGINVGGTAGYDFGLMRVEGEISYKYAEIRSISDPADGFSFRNPDGNLGVLAVMINGFLDFENPSSLTPYIGGGIGVASLFLRDTFAIDTRGGIDTIIVYPDDDDSVFAYQAGAGLDVAINDQFSLDIGYRYLRTSEADFGEDGFGTTSMEFESHNASLGFKLRF